MMTQKITIAGFLTAMMLSSMMYGAGIVSSATSTIDFPHDQSYINASQPTIIGTLRDDKNNPVKNQTVQILINGTVIGTALSDVNGIYRFSVAQVLADGQYQVSVICVNDAIVIGSNQFTIDTTLPSIAITYPQEGDVVTISNTVTISGTTESEAMVVTFLDADTFGNICYADAYGNWSIDYEIDNGAHTITAQATDIAGNQGDLSQVTNFSVNV
jgi:hypothetical protein